MSSNRFFTSFSLVAVEENVSENMVTIKAVTRLSLEAEENQVLSTTSIIVRDSGNPPLSSTVTITFNRERLEDQKTKHKSVSVYTMQVRQRPLVTPMSVIIISFL